MPKRWRWLAVVRHRERLPPDRRTHNDNNYWRPFDDDHDRRSLDDDNNDHHDNNRRTELSVSLFEHVSRDVAGVVPVRRDLSRQVSNALLLHDHDNNNNKHDDDDR